jgi:hypothetical protein
MKRKFIFAAIFAAVWLFLSCSLDPVGEGPGENGTRPNLIIVDWGSASDKYEDLPR